MSEQTYQIIERAIRGQLYVARGTSSLGGPAWRRPIRIENGDVVMLWGDCGIESRPEDLCRWTLDEWREAAGEDGQYMYRKVGLWAFAPADDPATDDIRYAHTSPESAGRQLHRLRNARNDALEEAARVCDALDDDGYSESWRSCARAAGERIRALKLQEPK